MYRQRLKTYKGLIVTADTATALAALEKQANDHGKWRVKYIPQPVKSDPLSLLPAGREVHLLFEKAGATAQEALNAAWGCAVPLGFTPKLRYPLMEPGSTEFHFFGPWQGLYGLLLAEGRGHLAWPSVCCAAQCDVGEWKGDKEEPRFVQAQLHRVGRNCGPIDGVIGPRTAAAIESLAVPRGTLTQVAEYLRTADPLKNQTQAGRGHLLIQGCDLVVEGYGGVKAWPMQNGAGIEVTGPGRLVVDVR
jgi:hypothetical protein